MKKYLKVLTPFLILVSSFFFAAQVYAATPVLSLQATGNGDNVLVDVTGDPNSSVSFNYNLSTGMQTRTIGTTDGSGNFSITISTSNYGINAGGSVYVIVDGQQSSYQIWPTTYSGSTLSLSQTSATVSVGQELSVTASNIVGTLYVASNTSQQSIVSAYVSGSNILLTGIAAGTATVSVCDNNGASCNTIYVTVTGSSSSQLSFSQNNISLVTGQENTVSVYNVTTSLYISSPGNTSVASATLSGNSLILSGLSVGSSSIVVCENGLSVCGTLEVNVTGANGASLSLSQTSLTLSQGQSMIITASNASTLTVTNSNISIASATVSGSNVTISGNNPGSTTFSICEYGTSDCGTVYVTVTSGSSSGMTFSQSSLSLAIGQSSVVTAYNTNASLYASSNNPNVATAVTSGANITVYGSTSGNATITVCENGIALCGSIYVYVGSNSTGSGLSFNEMNITTLTLSPSQSATLSAENASGLLYVSSNSNPSVANANVNGANIIITGSAAGTTNVTMCQASSTCGVVTVTVVSPALVSSVIPGCNGTAGYSTVTGQSCATNTAPAQTTSTGTSGSVTYVFTSYLKVGSTGDEVRELQTKLASLGFYKWAVTGIYGPLTEQAVKAFQAAHGLNTPGSVGPETRAALNNS